MTSEEVALAIIRVLQGLNVPHMLVGSLSCNAYGVARATQDVDIVVQFGDVRPSALVEPLGTQFRLDPQMTFESVTGTTRLIIHATGSSFKVELFFLSEDAHDQERFRRRVSYTLEGTETFLPTAEDVVVTKLRWYSLARRPKDIADVRNVVTVQGDRLDWNYIGHWCDQHGTRELLEEVRRGSPPA